MHIKNKNYKNVKQHNLFIDTLIIISFMALSVFSILFIWYNNKLHFVGDTSFHMSRIYDLIKSKVLFPEYALDSFSYIGNAVMGMYPYVFLYVIVIIFYFVRSIKYAFFIAFIIWTFLTFLISFYSSLHLSKNKAISYLFAMIYTLSGEFTGMYFSSPDLGVYFSALFLPLVIFGFIYYLNEDKWLMLSIGMSMELFTSIITVLFTSFLLLLWLLTNYKRINRLKILNLCKAVLLTVITTTFVWLPLLKIMILNKLSVPTIKSIIPVDIVNFLGSTLANNFTPANFNQMLTIYSLLGIVLGIIMFRNLPRLLKQTYLFGAFILLFSSSIFPWKIFDGNSALAKMVRSLQFSVRLLVIPQIIFEFILAYCIVKHLRTCYRWTRNLSVFIMVLFILLIQLSSQAFYVNLNQGTANNFNQNKQGVINVEYKDYWPNSSISKQTNLFNHVGTSNNNNIQFTPHGNGNFDFNATNVNGRSVTVPFLYYHGATYKCYLDHKRVMVHPNKHQLLTLNHVKNGQHHLKISMPFSVLTLFSRAVSILSILAYLIIIITRLKNRALNHFGGLKKRIEASK